MAILENVRFLPEGKFKLVTGDYSGDYDYFYLSPTKKVRMYFIRADVVESADTIALEAIAPHSV